MSNPAIKGFTLPELMLTMVLSAGLSLSMLGVLSYPFKFLTLQQQNLYERHYLNAQGVWLAAELQRMVDKGQIHWHITENCLLYGPMEGVRVERGMLQWRGGERGCQDGYWQSLTDPSQIIFNGLELEKEELGWRLMLTAQSLREPVKYWSWQYHSISELVLNNSGVTDNGATPQ